MDMKFWQKQEPGKPLFPDVEWNKPERRDQAGKLGIIGGNKLGFLAVAESYQEALRAGVGEARVLLPDALKKNVPANMTDVLFAPTNQSGSLANEALTEILALERWADVLLLCGDAGRNSQTAIVYEELIKKSEIPVVLTRDAIDLVQNSFLASLAQVQKIFRAIFYPKMITFSIQLSQLVEALHKFTITYPVTVCVFHADNLIIAHSGEVVTQKWDAPMAIWRGTVGARAASYLIWSPKAPLAAISTAICKM